MRHKNSPVDTYFCCRSNPAYGDPDCHKTATVLKDVNATPFLVVMDTHMTETALLADLVLPAATYLESWGAEFAPPLDGIPVLNFHQPAVSLISPAQALRSPTFDSGKLVENVFQPLGEAKEVGNVCLKLARDLGGEIKRHLPYQDTQEFATKMFLSTLLEGINTEELREQGFLINEDASPIIDQSRVIERRFRLPDYVPISAQEKKNPDQFILTTFKTNLGTSGTENSKWAREIFHENRLWINKQKAKQLGISSGDNVRVTSSVGSLVLRVLATNRIHPESVALAEGLGHTAFGSMAQAQISRSKDRDTRLVWWGKKGKGVNPFSIIENKADPVGGGYASKDTVVQVQKIEE
jgi:thiosulfate reductase/polysulfide reductase chain A